MLNYLKKSAKLFAECDCILIGSGAGLTAAAGIDYTDKVAFSQIYPGWVKRGFTMQYQLMGYRNWSEVEMWGYYTVHLNYVYFQQTNNELYSMLRTIIGNNDYFSFTSNVDELFHKNGFDRSKIYSPQGSYGKIQCATPCSDEVWDIKPYFDKMYAALDPETQVLNDEAAVPRCPNCGGNMFINVRIDHSFSELPYQPELARLQNWLDQNREKKLLLLELGSGYSTPTVIRHPMEHIAQALPHSSFIRVNRDHANISNLPEQRKISITGDIGNYICTLASSVR